VVEGFEAFECAKKPDVRLWVPQVGLHYWAVQGCTHQDDVLRSVGTTASKGEETVRDNRPDKDRDSLRSWAGAGSTGTLRAKRD